MFGQAQNPALAGPGEITGSPGDVLSAAAGALREPHRPPGRFHSHKPCRPRSKNRCSKQGRLKSSRYSHSSNRRSKWDHGSIGPLGCSIRCRNPPRHHCTTGCCCCHTPLAKQPPTQPPLFQSLEIASLAWLFSSLSPTLETVRQKSAPYASPLARAFSAPIPQPLPAFACRVKT
jgi:hypothetical protein